MCWSRNTPIIARSYRQAEIYARAGVELDRSTLADRVGQSARLLRPSVDVVGTHVMAADRVHADDTTWAGTGTWSRQHQDRPAVVLCARRPTFCGHRASGGAVLLQPKSQRGTSASHLAGFRGILQADGYTGYAGIYETGVTEAACMAHAAGRSSN